MASEREQRPRLSREPVLDCAVDLADRDGIETVTMGNLAGELGVEAMSLYYHVANKDELLDVMVEEVIREINRAVEPLVADSPRPCARLRDASEHQISRGIRTLANAVRNQTAH